PPRRLQSTVWLGLLSIAAQAWAVAGHAPLAAEPPAQEREAVCFAEFIPFPAERHRGFIFSLPDGSTCSSTVHFVNTSRGSLSFQWIDLVMPGRFPFPVARVYEGGSPGLSGPGPARAAEFGPRWSLRPGGAILALRGAGEMLLHDDDGREVLFLRREEGLYRPAPSSGRARWRRLAVAADGTIDATDDTGALYRFEPTRDPAHYVLAERIDPAGHRVRFVRRDGLLERLETDEGEFVELVRDPTPSLGSARLARPARVRALRDSRGRSVRFLYDAAGRLEQVVTLEGERFAIASDLAGRLVSITHASGDPVLSVSYGADGRVERLRAKGSEWRYAYDGPGGPAIVKAAGGSEEVNPIEISIDPDNPCDGFCEVEFSGSTCLKCFGGGSAGGGSASDDNNGGQESCGGFTLEQSADLVLVDDLVQFHVVRGSNCTGTTTWSGTPQPCSGDDCTSWWSSPGTYTVAATISGTSRSATVNVIVPACSLSLSGPSFVSTGDTVTYRVSTDCAGILWDAGPLACPRTAQGSASFTTTFVAAGATEVSVSGTASSGVEVVRTLAVNVAACSVGILADQLQALVGDTLCFQATPAAVPGAAYD
ncbi:MAG: DUF6531 domain-containing protein, partial [Planctomycetota bacterium]